MGGPPVAVSSWFDAVAAAAKPDNDGSLPAAHASARVYRSRAKADNTRAAYRSAVRAWCAWCDRNGVPALPAAPPRSRRLPRRRARSRPGRQHLETPRRGDPLLAQGRRPPSPTDTADVSETMAVIRRGAPNPQKRRAATLTVLREFLASIPDDFPGIRDRALLLASFTRALRRSELSGILLSDLERCRQRSVAAW
jgi:integrase